MMIRSASTWLLVASTGIGISVAAAGCGSGHRGTKNPCAGGACDNISACELGVCDDSEFATMIAGHASPNSASFANGAAAQCPYRADEASVDQVTARFDDADIPEFKRGRGRHTNYHQGNALPQDHELQQHLLGVQSELFACLDVAACFQDTQIVDGELDFRFELEPDGRVSAVSVDPSAGLDLPIVRACARRSIYDFKFPSYRGSRMVVSYRVEIAESV